MDTSKAKFRCLDPQSIYVLLIQSIIFTKGKLVVFIYL